MTGPDEIDHNSDLSRVMALDVGTKTIGIAISDALRIAAHPRTTLARKGGPTDIAALVVLVADEEIGHVVVGLPLAPSGKVGHRARLVTDFAEKLAKEINVPVEMWDERFSTAEAERVLIDANLSRARRKQVIDKQAASIILQGWLDRTTTVEPT